MKKYNISCLHCGESHEVDSNNAGAMADQSGMHPFMSQRDGLAIVWLCPPCTAPVKQAVRLLIDAFGDEARYIAMVSLINRDGHPGPRLVSDCILPDRKSE